MELKSRQSAYRLTWAVEHLENFEGRFEAEIRDFPGSDFMPRLMDISPYNLPNPLIFYAAFDFLERTDYPYNEVYWPIMSRRMYDVICSVGTFSHRVIPIAMVDDTTRYARDLMSQPFTQDVVLNSEVTNFGDFLAVQLLEQKDYFDFERSEYRRNSRRSEWIDSVEVYALNEPLEGFPPLFRLSTDPVELFISAKTREALREAGIRGTAYYSLEDGYSLQDEIDIPVQLPTYS
jgi:hypothetical protein